MFIRLKFRCVDISVSSFCCLFVCFLLYFLLLLVYFLNFWIYASTQILVDCDLSYICSLFKITDWFHTLHDPFYISYKTNEFVDVCFNYKTNGKYSQIIHKSCCVIAFVISFQKLKRASRSTYFKFA